MIRVEAVGENGEHYKKLGLTGTFLGEACLQISPWLLPTLLSQMSAYLMCGTYLIW